MSHQLLFLIIVWSVHYANGTYKLVPFVTPGLPACYVARTQYEYVSGAARRCPHDVNSMSACGKDGVSYYFYCGDDHECCYHDGCPACCTSQTTLNMAEIAGIVIASAVFFVILVSVVYVLAGKFCAKRSFS